MSDTTKAADLPDGSVVAIDCHVFVKNHPTVNAPWRSTNGSHVGDWKVDSALALGGKVLRFGYDG